MCSTSPVSRSFTYTCIPFDTGWDDRFRAVDSNATYRPPSLMDGPQPPSEGPLVPSPSWPAAFTLTRSIVPVRRSRRKMSLARLVSPGTRFVAREAKATKRPSGLIAG